MMKEEEYRENLAHYLPKEFKLALGLQDRYAPFKEREDFIEHHLQLLDERAKVSLLRELKEEYAIGGMKQVAAILSNTPEILSGAFSSLRRMQIKPTRKAVLSKKEPEIPREIMDYEYILEDILEEVEDEEYGDED